MNTAKQQVQAPPSQVVAPGRILGRYELLVPIAAGGMAMVWAARMKGTRGFQKIVAVKTMLPKLSEDQQFEQMFLDEATLASKVRHPHVVEILDLGEESGVLYLVMEWIDGVPLNQLMKAAKKKRGAIPLPIAIRIVTQACAGLHAAHEIMNDEGESVGLVHRDVSPQNILVTFDGVAKVVDFGVAKATAVGDGATGAGQIKGKVGYMAPEQIKGDDLDRRVDVFAMGIVLYALTTGKHPFRRESEAATMYNIASPDAVIYPSRAVPNYPEALEKVVTKALAKERDQRFETANSLLRALDALPASLRGATDADVGAFVRELLGDERDRQKQELAKALERADAREQEQTSSGLVPAIPLSHQSSTTLAAQDAGTGSDITGAVATDIDHPFRKRSRKTPLAIGAVVVVLAAGAYFVITSGSEPAVEDVAQKNGTSAQPKPSEESGGIKVETETASKPEDTPPVGSALDLGQLPVEKSPPASEADKAPSFSPQAPARPKSKPKRKESWRKDPGF